MIVTIEKTFNVIWQVPVQRKGLQRFLLYWGVLTFGPPLLVGSLIVSSYLLYLPFVSGLDTYGIRESLLAYIPIASEAAVFYLPVLRRAKLPGGVQARTDWRACNHDLL